jgi:hypothetical protein
MAVWLLGGGQFGGRRVVIWSSTGNVLRWQRLQRASMGLNGAGRRDGRWYSDGHVGAQ